MLTLHLGVVDMPYATQGGQTTGEVAQILEDKYHVMEVFFELHKDEIAAAMVESMGDAIDGLSMGMPVGNNALGAVEGMIGARFKTFIDMKEMDGLGIFPKVPTQASLDGVSHRFKGKRGVPGRPSFQDTGLYEDSFVAWFQQ